MKRRLLAILGGLSLMLFALTLVFWARSHLQIDYVSGFDPPLAFEFVSSSGAMRVEWGELVTYPSGLTHGWHGTFWPLRPERRTPSPNLTEGIIVSD